MARAKNVFTLVSTAFAGDGIPDETVRDILSELRLNRRDIEQRMRRIATSSILLTAILLLLLAGDVSEASLGFAKVTNLGPIEVALPVVLSYFGYDFARCLCDLRFLTWTHDTIMRTKFRKLYDNHITLLIAPSSYQHRSERLAVTSNFRFVEVYASLSFAVQATVTFGTPGALLLLIYSTLFSKRPVAFIWILLSLIAAILLIICSVFEILLPVISFTHKGPAKGQRRDSVIPRQR